MVKLKDCLDDYGFETWRGRIETRYYAAFKKNPVKDFYLTEAWLTLRAEVLGQYGRKCMKCKSKCKIMQVDHIRPRFIYPKLALCFENLQVLCIDCNHEKGLQIIDYRPKE